MKLLHVTRLQRAQRALRSLPDRAYRRRKHLRQRLRYGFGPEHVVFLFGGRRSGGSLLARALDASAAARVYDKHNAMAFQDGRLRSNPWLRVLVAMNGAPTVAFKALDDSHRAVEVLAEWPEARVVWVYRAWRDAVNATVVRWGQRHAEVIDALVHGEFERVLGGAGVSDEVLATLRTHWRPGLGPSDASALYWWLWNHRVEAAELATHPRVHLVRYADLLELPDRTVAALFDFVDLPFEPEVVERLFQRPLVRRPPPGVEPHIAALCDALELRLDAARDAADTSPRARGR